MTRSRQMVRGLGMTSYYRRGDGRRGVVKKVWLEVRKEPQARPSSLTILTRTRTKKRKVMAVTAVAEANEKSEARVAFGEAK